MAKQIRVTVKNHRLLAELSKRLDIAEPSDLVNYILQDYKRLQATSNITPRQLTTETSNVKDLEDLM